MNRSNHLISMRPAAGRRRLAGGLTVLAAAAIAGCGSGHHQPARTAGTGQGQTVASLGTPQAAAGRSHDRKVAHRAGATPRPRPPVIAAGPVIKTFTGDGDRAIGSLAEKQAIVVQWSTSTPSIQLFTAQGIVLVNASSPVGRVRLAQGDYSGLRVATPGRWTVQLRLAH